MRSAARAPSAVGVHVAPSAVGEHGDKKSTVTRKVKITRTSSMVKITRTDYIDTLPPPRNELSPSELIGGNYYLRYS